MLALNRRTNVVSLIGLILSAFLSFNVYADGFIPMPSQNTYVGIFGGYGATSNNNVSQHGTAFFGAGAGGPLAVNAAGSTQTDGVGIVGAHIGYKLQNWAMPNWWEMLPAVEGEAYYLGVRQHVAMDNPTPRAPEHTFDDTFPMNTGVFLGNMVFNFNNAHPDQVQPYAGVGIGGAIVSIHSANSYQSSPAEFGINHFNSNTNDSDWAFAAQAKLGLRYNVTQRLSVFAEYRYLYLGKTNYNFGSTQYPTHVPTTTWRVLMGSQNYNMGAIGLDYAIG